MPDAYAAASPAALLPLGCPQLLVSGGQDEDVPLALTRAYAAQARSSGDHITCAPIHALCTALYVCHGIARWGVGTISEVCPLQTSVSAAVTVVAVQAGGVSNSRALRDHHPDGPELATAEARDGAAAGAHSDPVHGTLCTAMTGSGLLDDWPTTLRLRQQSTLRLTLLNDSPRAILLATTAP